MPMTTPDRRNDCADVTVPALSHQGGDVRPIRAAAVILTIAFTAAACTSDDTLSTEDFATGAGTSSDEHPATLDFTGRPADYLAELSDRSAAFFIDLDAAMEPLRTASTPEAAMVAAPDVFVELQEPLTQARRELRSMQPPTEYAVDHQLLLGWLEDESAIRSDQAMAADASDLEAFTDLEQRSTILFDRMALEVSPPVALLVEAETVDGIRERYPELPDEEVAYLAGAARAQAAFSTHNRAFSRAVQQTYGTSTDAFEALRAAGAGSAFLASRVLAEQLAAPASFAEDHENYLTYLDRAIEVDGGIGEAVAAEDVAAFAVGNLELTLASARTQQRLSPAMREVVLGATPASLDVSSDEYAQDLDELLRDLRVWFDPAAIPGLPSFDEGERDAAVVATAPILADELGRSLDELLAFSAPPDLAADHGRLTEWLQDAKILLGALDESTDAPTTVWLALFTQTCTTAEALSPDVAPLTAVYFGQPTLLDSC